MTTSANPWKAWGMALAPAMLLFILPFPGTVALRLLLLSISLFVAAVVWKRLAPPPLPCKWPLVIWAAVALASVPASFDPSYSLGEVKNEVGYCMMAFVAFYVLASNEGQVRRIAAGLVAGMIVMLAGAFLMQIGGQVTVTPAGQRLWNEGTFIGGSGVYATYLLTALPLLLVALLAGKRIMAAAVTFCAILVAGYFTGQKIFILVAALQLALLLWLLGRGGLIRISRKWGWVMAAMAVVVLGVMLQQILANRAMTDNPLRDNIVQDVRVRQWPLIMDRVMEHPLAGVGFGRNAMRQAYPDLLPRDVPLFWHAHNVFLNYGISMGVPGMLALLLVFGSLLRAFWTLADRGSATQRAIGAAGLAMVAGVIARNLSNDFFMRDMSLLFWALTGLLLGFGRRLIRDDSGNGAGPEQNAAMGTRPT